MLEVGDLILYIDIHTITVDEVKVLHVEHDCRTVNRNYQSKCMLFDGW